MAFDLRLVMIEVNHIPLVRVICLLFMLCDSYREIERGLFYYIIYRGRVLSICLIWKLWWFSYDIWKFFLSIIIFESYNDRFRETFRHLFGDICSLAYWLIFTFMQRKCFNEQVL